MEKLIVSERETHCSYISYISEGIISAGIKDVRFSLSFDAQRILLACEFESQGAERIRKIVEEKIAEIICVGYKYREMMPLIQPAGLSAEEREVLLAAILAADFVEDKKYVLSRLKEMAHHSIDGFYLFRLQALRDKWKGVAQCVPGYFTKERLSEFMEYLIGGSAGKIFLKDSDVYDSRCKKLHRAMLIENAKSEINIFREIVLSGAGKIECLGELSVRQEDFLKKYYAGRVGFFAENK